MAASAMRLLVTACLGLALLAGIPTAVDLTARASADLGPLARLSADVREGDPCSAAGQRISKPEGPLECRVIAGNRLVYRQLSHQPQSPGITPSPEPIDTCRLRDMRPNRGLPPGPGGTLISEAIAYPVTSATRPLVMPPAGKTRVAVLPYDFSDVPGSVDVGSWLRPQLDYVSEWIEHYSHGRVEYEWVTSETWIRASKPSSEYQFISEWRGGIMPPDLPQGPFKSDQWIAQDLLNSAPKSLDLTDVKSVFFVYPPDVHYIYDMPVREVSVSHPDLPGTFLMFTSGRYLYEADMPLWSYMIHEYGHYQGIPGHAPWDGSPLDVMTNQHGLAITLGTWSRLTMDWQDTREIYCTTRDRLAREAVTLSAIDSEEVGTKAVMVRLSESQALIIESRRRSTWSSGARGWPGLPMGFYGLTVTKVDTSIDRNRVQGSGSYLDFVEAGDRGHGILFSPGTRTPPFDLNKVVYEGESIITHGIRVSLIKSGDHDSVQLSLASDPEPTPSPIPTPSPTPTPTPTPTATPSPTPTPTPTPTATPSQTPTPSPTPTPTPTATPAEMITITGSGRTIPDRRRVFVTLATEGISPGSRIQPWVVQSGKCATVRATPVRVRLDGTVRWSRKSNVAVTVWFSHNDTISERAQIPGLDGRWRSC